MATVYEWFGLKTTRTVFDGLASKPAAAVFSSLASKLVGRVSRIGPQNHRDSFLVFASKSSGLRLVDYATKPTEGGRRGTRVEI
jgi:hypothetical protein